MCAAGNMPPAKRTTLEPAKKTVIPIPVLRGRNLKKSHVANMTVLSGYAAPNPAQPTQLSLVPVPMPGMTAAVTPVSNAA